MKCLSNLHISRMIHIETSLVIALGCPPSNSSQMRSSVVICSPATREPYVSKHQSTFHLSGINLRDERKVQSTCDWNKDLSKTLILFKCCPISSWSDPPSHLRLCPVASMTLRCTMMIWKSRPYTIFSHQHNALEDVWLIGPQFSSSHPLCRPKYRRNFWSPRFDIHLHSTFASLPLNLASRLQGLPNCSSSCSCSSQ